MLFGMYPFFCSLLGSVFLPGGCLHKLVSALYWHSAPALAGQAVQPWQVLTVTQRAHSSAAAQVLMGLFSTKSEAECRGLSALSTTVERAVQTPVVVRESFVVCKFGGRSKVRDSLQFFIFACSELSRFGLM